MQNKKLFLVLGLLVTGDDHGVETQKRGQNYCGSVDV
jgi:hypothetical protein